MYVADSTVKLDLSDGESNTHNSFVSPCLSMTNFVEDHQSISNDLTQEEFKDDSNLEKTDQLLQQKKDIIFVSKISSTLLQTAKDNFTNYEPSLTSIGEVDDNNCNQRSPTTVINNGTNSMPIVKTLIVQQQKQRPLQYSSCSTTISPTLHPDENKNSILLLKTPSAYVSLTTATLKQQQQQPQQQQHSQIHHSDSHHSDQSATHQNGDYHHHQQQDQRKVLTKLFLPNKIHVKPIQHQKQLQMGNATNESSYLGIKHASHNTSSKIRVLNLRKRFTKSTTNH